VDEIGIGMQMTCHLIIVINSSKAKKKKKGASKADK
jgi:hypothetical protein